MSDKTLHIENLASRQHDRLNDRKLAEQLAYIYSRENLGLQSRTIAAGGRTQLDNRDAVVFISGSGGGFNTTLPPANTWRPGKSPIIIFKRIDSAIGTYRLVPGATETLDGGAPGAGLVVAGAGSLKVISDGVSAWYSI